MDLRVLSKVVEKEREHLKQNDGLTCLMGEHGPVSMRLAEAVIAYAQSLEERIKKLESQ